MIIYELETFKTIKFIPYASCLYKLGKISDEYNRDITEREI